MNKLLVIVPSLEIGGAEQLVVGQLNEFFEQGYKVYLCIISNKIHQPLLNQLLIPKENLLILNCSNSTISPNAFKELFFKKRFVVRFIKANSIQTILAHLPLAHLWGRLIKAARPSIKLICYHHSVQYSANPIDTIFKKLFHLINYHFSKKYDDLHIFISRAVENDIKKNLYVKNGLVINNAIKDSFHFVKSHSKAKESLFDVNIIVPGRLNPVKGHLYFLEVFSKLKKNTSRKIFLTIAGGGFLQDEIEKKIAQLQIEESCKITGTLNNSELLAVIYEQDLVVIPSLFEGLGIVAIEALMLGKTTLASDAGGLAEVIQNGRNGYIFKSNNFDDCYEKLKDIVDHFEEKKIPEEILRSDFVRRFEFQTHFKEIESALEPYLKPG